MPATRAMLRIVMLVTVWQAAINATTTTTDTNVSSNQTSPQYNETSPTQNCTDLSESASLNETDHGNATDRNCNSNITERSHVNGSCVNVNETCNCIPGSIGKYSCNITCENDTVGIGCNDTCICDITDEGTNIVSMDQINAKEDAIIHGLNCTCNQTDEVSRDLPGNCTCNETEKLTTETNARPTGYDGRLETYLRIAVIAGGSAAAVVVAIVLICYLVRRRRSRKSLKLEDIDIEDSRSIVNSAADRWSNRFSDVVENPQYVSNSDDFLNEIRLKFEKKAQSQESVNETDSNTGSLTVAARTDNGSTREVRPYSFCQLKEDADAAGDLTVVGTGNVNSNQAESVCIGKARAREVRAYSFCRLKEEVDGADDVTTNECDTEFSLQGTCVFNVLTAEMSVKNNAPSGASFDDSKSGDIDRQSSLAIYNVLEPGTEDCIASRKISTMRASGINVVNESSARIDNDDDADDVYNSLNENPIQTAPTNVYDTFANVRKESKKKDMRLKSVCSEGSDNEYDVVDRSLSVAVPDVLYSGTGDVQAYPNPGVSTDSVEDLYDLCGGGTVVATPACDEYDEVPPDLAAPKKEKPRTQAVKSRVNSDVIPGPAINRRPKNTDRAKSSASLSRKSVPNTLSLERSSACHSGHRKSCSDSNIEVEPIRETSKISEDSFGDRPSGEVTINTDNMNLESDSSDNEHITEALYDDIDDVVETNKSTDVVASIPVANKFEDKGTTGKRLSRNIKYSLARKNVDYEDFKLPFC